MSEESSLPVKKLVSIIILIFELLLIVGTIIIIYKFFGKSKSEKVRDFRSDVQLMANAISSALGSEGYGSVKTESKVKYVNEPSVWVYYEVLMPPANIKWSDDWPEMVFYNGEPDVESLRKEIKKLYPDAEEVSPNYWIATNVPVIISNVLGNNSFMDLDGNMLVRKIEAGPVGNMIRYYVCSPGALCFYDGYRVVPYIAKNSEMTLVMGHKKISKRSWLVIKREREYLTRFSFVPCGGEVVFSSGLCQCETKIVPVFRIEGENLIEIGKMAICVGDGLTDCVIAESPCIPDMGDVFSKDLSEMIFERSVNDYGSSVVISFNKAIE